MSAFSQDDSSQDTRCSSIQGVFVADTNQCYDKNLDNYDPNFNELLNNNSMGSNFTNNFGNAHHCCGHMMGGDGGNNFADARIRDTDTGTGSMRSITGYNDTSLYDWGNNATTFHGDLA